MTYRPGEKPKQQPTAEDGIQVRLVTAAVKAAVARIKDLNAAAPDRCLVSLTKPELNALIIDILSAYIAERATIAFEEDLQTSTIFSMFH